LYLKIKGVRKMKNVVYICPKCDKAQKIPESANPKFVWPRFMRQGCQACRLEKTLAHLRSDKFSLKPLFISDGETATGRDVIHDLTGLESGAALAAEVERFLAENITASIS
jgi:hypothetical protein